MTSNKICQAEPVCPVVINNKGIVPSSQLTHRGVHFSLKFRHGTSVRIINPLIEDTLRMKMKMKMKMVLAYSETVTIKGRH